MAQCVQRAKNRQTSYSFFRKGVQFCYYLYLKLDMHRNQTELSQQGYTSSDFLEKLLGKSSIKSTFKQSIPDPDQKNIKNHPSIANILFQKQQIYRSNTDRSFKTLNQVENCNLSLHHFGQFFKSILRQYESEENVQMTWLKFELASYDVKGLEKVISEIQTQHSIRSLRTEEKKQDLHVEHINTDCSHQNSLANSVSRSQPSSRKKSHSLDQMQKNRINLVSMRCTGNSVGKKQVKKTSKQLRQILRVKYRGIHKKMNGNQIKIKEIIARK